MASRIGKRVVNQVKILGCGVGRRTTPIAGTTARWAHESSYDRNPDDDQIQARGVPDDLIKQQPDKYWGPNPKTGVFGPADTNGVVESVGESFSSSSTQEDLQTWFRPQEDVDKPPPSYT